jgi:hypothetical protein
MKYVPALLSAQAPHPPPAFYRARAATGHDPIRLNRIMIFLLLKHYPFGKTIATFPEHALTLPGAGCLASQIPQLIQHAHSQTTKAWSWIARFARNDERYGSIPLMAFPVGLQAASGRSP